MHVSWKGHHNFSGTGAIEQHDMLVTRAISVSIKNHLLLYTITCKHAVRGAWGLQRAWGSNFTGKLTFHEALRNSCLKLTMLIRDMWLQKRLYIHVALRVILTPSIGHILYVNHGNFNFLSDTLLKPKNRLIDTCSNTDRSKKPV